METMTASTDDDLRRVSGTAGTGRVMRYGCLAALVAVVLSVASAAMATPPFYALLPSDYPGPLIRVCHTEYGICLIPVTIQPGAPCECVTAGGTWVSGVTVH